jgi:hydrogenase maturation protease
METGIPVFIIGYGSPLRGDDGIGWHIANQLLADEFPLGASRSVSVQACHQLTPDLAEPVSRARCVIFIDAAHDVPAGEVECRPIAPGEVSALSFSHHIDPGGLLAWARWLYGRCPTAAFVLAVGGESFGYNENVSARVLAAVPIVLEHVAALVAQKT